MSSFVGSSLLEPSSRFSAGNLDGWVDVPLRKMVEERYQPTIYVEPASDRLGAGSHEPRRGVIGHSLSVMLSRRRSSLRCRSGTNVAAAAASWGSRPPGPVIPRWPVKRG